MIAGLKKIPAWIIACYLFFCAGLLYWVVIYSGSGDGDTLEPCPYVMAGLARESPLQGFFPAPQSSFMVYRRPAGRFLRIQSARG